MAVRRTVRDEAQTAAHLAGEPIPPLPQGRHTADLLTDAETGDVAGVSASTVRV